MFACPTCVKEGKVAKVHLAGHAWSGKNRPQRYRCSKCGKTTLNPVDIQERR